MTEEEIEIIVYMKKLMASRSLYHSSEKYVELFRELETLCMCYCNHVWAEDYIDIDLDRSQKIIYCELCECVLQ
jgi:hypothetical protein